MISIEEAHLSLTRLTHYSINIESLQRILGDSEKGYHYLSLLQENLKNCLTMHFTTTKVLHDTSFFNSFPNLERLTINSYCKKDS